MKIIKKRGLLKRLKNIEGKNEQQLQTIKDQKEQLRMIEHETNSAEKKYQVLNVLPRGVKVQKMQKKRLKKL